MASKRMWYQDEDWDVLREILSAQSATRSDQTQSSHPMHTLPVTAGSPGKCVPVPHRQNICGDGTSAQDLVQDAL